MVEKCEVSLTVEMSLDVKLKLQFFKDVKALEEQNHLSNFSGYMIFEFNLENFLPEDKLHIHAAFLSSSVIKVFELVDDESCIEEAQEKLVRRTDAIEKLIGHTVPVKGVIFFPRKVRLPTSSMMPDNSVLYKGELLQSFIFPEASSGGSRFALAQMLDFSYFKQCHPKTEEEALSQAAQYFFCQQYGLKIERFTQVTFNSIKLTSVQEGIKKDLLKGNTLVHGSYGIGKTIAIVSAIKELIQQYKKLIRQNPCQQTDLNILFVSAQSLLINDELKLSPFLQMIQRWISEICKSLQCSAHLRLVDYTHFLAHNRGIDYAMQAKREKGQNVNVFTYLLKRSDLETFCTGSSHLDKFDAIILEETHALDPFVMKKIITDFLEMTNEKCTELRNTKLWIVSNAEKIASDVSGFKVSPNIEEETQLGNFRNTPAITSLAEAINLKIGPERYPSTPMSMSSIKCSIPATYTYEWEDKKRLNKIVKLAERWKRWLPKASVLFVDCEKSDLLEELHAKDIQVCRYEDKYSRNESSIPLLLQHSDPVEAIVAGAEWHVLIVHVKVKTLNSVKVVRLFNKRVISRATTKVYIFSDIKFDGTQTDNIVKMSDLKTLERESSGTSNSFHDDDTQSDVGAMCNISISQTTTESLVQMIDDYLHSSESITSLLEGCSLYPIRYLDDCLSHLHEDIYLVYGRGKAFIFQSSSGSHDELTWAQTLLSNVWNVRLSTYCSSALVSYCETLPVEIDRISRLLDLLQQKSWSSKPFSGSGVTSVNEEAAALFAKASKFICLFSSNFRSNCRGPQLLWAL